MRRAMTRRAAVPTGLARHWSVPAEPVLNAVRCGSSSFCLRARRPTEAVPQRARVRDQFVRVPAKAGRATSNCAMSCGVVPVWTRSATISPTTGTNLNPWPEKPQASTT